MWPSYQSPYWVKARKISVDLSGISQVSSKCFWPSAWWVTASVSQRHSVTICQTVRSLRRPKPRLQENNDTSPRQTPTSRASLQGTEGLWMCVRRVWSISYLHPLKLRTLTQVTKIQFLYSWKDFDVCHYKKYVSSASASFKSKYIFSTFNIAYNYFAKDKNLVSLNSFSSTVCPTGGTI